MLKVETDAILLRQYSFSDAEAGILSKGLPNKTIPDVVDERADVQL